MSEEQTNARRQRRKDIAWLMWDLLERRRECARRVPYKLGFMREVEWNAYDRFDRMIQMLRELPNAR